MHDLSAQECLFALLRLFSWAGLAVTVAAGFYFFRSRERFFGVHADLPSENASSLGYNKFQAVALWVHLLLMFSLFAFMLH